MRQIDLVVTALAAGFLAGVAWTLATPGPDKGWLDWLGRVLLAAAVLLTLLFLWRRARRPEERRMIGVLWDVLTFWPRRFHPFAVRPYAERAVPEVEHRLAYHLDEGRAVVISAHSQGTVLIFAALLQLARCPDLRLDRVAVVTYGSPLRQLYQRFFPDYLDLGRQFRELLPRLATLDHGKSGWQNYYRLTDYIGQAFFDADCNDDEQKWTGSEACLADPAQEPLLSDQPLEQPVNGHPEPSRTAWIELAAHSAYRNETAVKQWVSETRGHLASLGVQRQPPVHPDRHGDLIDPAAERGADPGQH